ncbi:hypothetical protein BSNK01_22270 [Bacillaceae bacterium]
MTLLAKVIFLQKAKEELIDKLKDPKTTYSEMTEIYQKMKQINLEMQEIKYLYYRNKKAGPAPQEAPAGEWPIFRKNYPVDS